MTHACERHSASTVVPHETPRPVRADDTVGDVAHRYAGALEAMKAMGINHCCGAHLTLSQAAAAAGVPLGTLLAAFEPPATGSPDRVVLDVRGLEPPEPLVRVLAAIDRLDPGAVLEVRHDRRPILLYPQLDDRGFAHETDEPEPGLVRIVIRRASA